MAGFNEGHDTWERQMKNTWRKVLVISFLSLTVLACPRQSRAQNYVYEYGSYPWTTPMSVPGGYVDAGNGNLHIEIPIASIPERGHVPFVAKLVYDSHIWQQVTVNSSTSWQPTNVPFSSGGWRLITTGGRGLGVNYTEFEEGECETEVNHQFKFTPYYGFKNWSFTTSDGHSIPFGTVETTEYGDICGSGGGGTSNGIATDASGYHLYVTNWDQAVVYAPDGTKVYPNVEDTNGNYYTNVDQYGDVTDTLGNTPITTTVNGSTITYAVMNSQGSASNYVVTTESIPINSAFGQSGITEYSGSITAIKTIELPDGTTYSFTYDQGSTGAHFGTLTGMTLPTTGSVTYGYTNFADAYGNQTDWLSSYSFNGGTWTFVPTVTSACTSSCTQKVVATGPAQETATYAFSLNTAGAWNTSLAQGDTTLTTAYNFSNLPYVVPTTSKISRTVPGGTVSKTTTFTYDSSNLGNITQITESSYGVTAYRTTNYTYLSNSDNNMVNKKQTAIVCAGAGPCSSSNYLSMTQINYDTATTSSITGVIQHDDTNFGTSYNARGNANQIERFYLGGNTSGTMNYDMTGQLLSSTDNNGNKTSFSYADHYNNDSSSGPTPATPAGLTNAYPTTITLPAPFSWTITASYYLHTGQKSTMTNQNGVTTTNDYVDSFNRPTQSVTPTGSGSLNSWREIVYNASETKVDSYLGIQSNSPTTSCGTTGACRQDEIQLDTFGRPTQQILVSDPSGATTVTASYNTDGRVSSVTNPERSQTSTTNGSDSLVYDSMGRVTQVTHSDGTSSYVYYGASVTGSGVGGIASMLCSTGGPGYPTLYVDESGKMRQSWADAFGRTIELDEPNNSGTLAVNTCYTYDQLGNLTGVTQGAQTRTYSYDALSRLTSSVTPETTTNYNYLTANQTLCSGNPNLPCVRSDARHTPIDYAYDQLNRLTGITYTDGKTHAIGYTYDAGTNQKGFRTGMTDGSGSTTWTYFTNGWLQKEQRTIAGKTNTLSYTYNGDGTVATITYPSANVVTYGIGSDERSTTATDMTHNLNYVATASYMPPGELSSMIFGKATGFSGITDTAGFNSRLFFTGAKASTSSATAQNVSLSYNNNGTVSSIQNNVTSGLSESFTYDSLDRILSAATSATSGAGCWGQSFGPSGTPPAGPPDDRWSNLTEINVTQCTASSLSVTASSSTNQVTTTGYGYDVVGNMTADGRTGYAYSFDAENHMTQASGTPSGTWTYTYDGNGLRVEKTNGTSGTLYWRNLAGNTIAETDLTGSTTDSAYREYIFFAGQRVAQRDATTPTPNVYFYYTDQVGSTTAISTAAGVSCYQATFTPYGQEMATQTTCSTNYKFTGYERDAETGFDYAFARYYNSTLGRFMSPDPLAGSIADPQTLNRYAYVGNSATNFADPSGTHKCNAPQGQSIPGLCDGGGYGDGSDDGWGLDSGAEFDFYWGKLTSLSDSGNYTSWDYMAFWGYGGYSALNFGNLVGRAIVALAKPECAAIFGGLPNAITALASSTYNTYSPGEANPYPNQIEAADWTNRTGSIASGQYGFTFWSTASPGGNLFFTSNFGNYAPGFPSSPDGFGQMTGFLHEFEHAANHSNALDLALDASPDSYAADAIKININCAPKEIETTSAPIATSLTPP
jgi:RHS repeat-associated protein